MALVGKLTTLNMGMREVDIIAKELMAALHLKAGPDVTQELIKAILSLAPYRPQS